MHSSVFISICLMFYTLMVYIMMVLARQYNILVLGFYIYSMKSISDKRGKRFFKTDKSSSVSFSLFEYSSGGQQAESRVTSEVPFHSFGPHVRSDVHAVSASVQCGGFNS